MATEDVEAEAVATREEVAEVDIRVAVFSAEAEEASPPAEVAGAVGSLLAEAGEVADAPGEELRYLKVIMALYCNCNNCRWYR